MDQSPNRAQGAPGRGGKGWGTPSPSLDVPLGFAGNDPRDYKKDRTSGWVISTWPLVMKSCWKNLKVLKLILK